MQGLNIPSFREDEDAVQDQIVKRLEILDAIARVPTLYSMMVHFLEKNQELSKEQMRAILMKAVDLEHQFKLGATMLYVVQEMRQYVRDQSKFDSTVQDFLNSVYEALPTPPTLPTLQQAADVYLEIVMAPVTIVGTVVNQAAESAKNSVFDSAFEAVENTFAQQRSMAFIGLGLTVAGIIYSVS